MTDSNSDLEIFVTPSTPNLTTENNQSNNQFYLQFLCSLTPKSFNGTRAEFNKFYTNCVNAMSLANNDQKHPLLVLQLQGKSYKSGDDFKATLDKLYQDQKIICNYGRVKYIKAKL